MKQFLKIKLSCSPFWLLPSVTLKPGLHFQLAITSANRICLVTSIPRASLKTLTNQEGLVWYLCTML